MAVKFDMSGIINDINKYINAYASAACNFAAKELQREAHVAMLNYYGSYAPKKYIRTGILGATSYIPSVETNGSYMFGGIKAGAEFMGGYTRKETDPEKVFNSGWITGYHTPSKKSTPAKTIVEAYINSGSFLKKAEAAGLKAAHSQSYQYFKF